MADTHSFLSVTEFTFLVDKGYDVKNIYNQVKQLYEGECIIPLNKRNTKNPKLLPQGNPVCEALQNAFPNAPNLYKLFLSIGITPPETLTFGKS